MTEPPRAAMAAVLLAFVSFVGRAETPARSHSESREAPAAGGTLSWFFGDGLDLLGDMRVDLPWRLRDDTSLFFALDARTNIRQASTSFDFEVQDVDYSLDIGVRGFGSAGRWVPGLRVSGFAGQQGTERVDENGQPWVRYVGVGFESEGFRRWTSGFAWKARAAAVLDEREVEADAVLSVEARVRTRGRGRLGLDLGLEALPGDGRLRGDVRAGPSLWLRAGATRRLSLFAHYVDSENPLGLGSDGLVVGADFSESGDGRRRGFPSPDVAGTVASGAGDGRVAGVLGLRIFSPSFGPDLRAALAVEGNLLTAEDTGEAYWLYHVGLERPRGGWVLGAWFYHRSNHTLAEPNDALTFINVLEVGGETADWARAGRRSRRLDSRLRGGYLTNSTFDKRRRWHARGGLRWTPVPDRSLQPFLLAELEDGDVERRLYALGLAFAMDAELRLEYREDNQYFGADRYVTLFMARLGF